MTTNNPFGKLKIERDDSDEDEINQQKKQLHYKISYLPLPRVKRRKS